MSTATLAERAPDATAPTVTNVYQCIVAVASEMAQHGIAKTRNNQKQGYKFRGIDEVMNALAPMLVRHRLVILPRVLSRDVTERATKTGGALFYVVVEVEFDFVSAADGSKHTVKTYGEAMDSADKATNKAMSAAYKYAAFQTFCIPTEGDNDADAHSHEVVSRTPAALSGDVARSDVRRVTEGNGSSASHGQAHAPAPGVGNPSGPNGEGSADLPEGAVFIERVDFTATKNPNVTRALVTLSTGEQLSTIKTQLAALAEQCAQEGCPVYCETENTRWGPNLIGLTRADGDKDDDEELPTLEPLTDDDIPF